MSPIPTDRPPSAATWITMTESPSIAITRTKGSNMPSRRRTNLVMLLCIWKAGRVQAFSNSAGSQLLQFSRGGDTAEEDNQLDEHIEDLISTVESSEDYSSEEVEDDPEAVSDIAVEAIEANDEEIDLVIETSVGDDDDDEEEEEESAKDAEEPDNELNEGGRKDAVEEKSELVLAENDDDDNAGGEADESVVPERTWSPDVETERRKRKSKLSSQESEEEIPRDGNEDDAFNEASPAHQSLARARRPNALYRFLLNHGRIGHILVMFCVFVVEFVITYIPPLAHLLGFIFSFILPEEDGHPSYRRAGPPQKVNAQYAGFVSSDGSSVRGKKRKEQVQQADKQAVEKLRRVGSIQDAKFRHVSADFMKRHHIGLYRDLEDTEELVVYEAAPVAVGRTRDGEEEESDVEWVVEALSKEEEEKSIPIETSFGVGLGSNGASISVGVQFGLTKKKKRRKTLAEAATEITSKPKPRPIGPRTSDRDGGGGVFGRIRAAGANSLVSRSLLGAYPGDAAPPSEAASASGVISLAEKYGYGDWSDDEDDVDESSFESPRRKVRNRKPKSASSSVKVEFGLSSDSNRRSRTEVSPKRPSRRRTEDESANPVPLTARSEILTGSKLPQRRRMQVRPPMEKLNEAQPSRTRRAREDSSKNNPVSTSRLEIDSKLPERRRVKVRPPMEKLNEAREKLKKKEDEE